MKPQYIIVIYDFSGDNPQTIAKMDHSTQQWAQKLSAIERETNLILSGIGDEFKTNGMSFDAKFQKYFLKMVQE